MKGSFVVAALAITLGTWPSPSYAANPGAGKAKFEATCAACHGTQGISVAPIYPNLAGQKEQYLITQLNAFKSGQRVNPIMNPMAKTLSGIDIANIAAYLSSLKSP